MTDQQWNEAIEGINSLRFQLVNNIMPPAHRHELNARLSMLLRNLADIEMWRSPKARES
jgi:hypothetical protein